MLSCFVQVQITMKYNLYVQLTYHNNEKGPVPRGSSKCSYRNKTNFLHSIYTHHFLCMENAVSFHITLWKKLDAERKRMEIRFVLSGF